MILDMYKGVANSPETTITNNINETDTIIYVLDETRIPGLPNLMVLGTGVSAETVKVLSIDGNAITVERGFQGIPKVWNAGTIIARNFTEYDYNALVENVKTLDADIGGLAGEGRTTETVKKNADDLAAHKAENVTQGNPHGIDAKANKIQQSWILATLQNGWTGNLYYRRNEFGTVEFRGTIGDGTTSIGTVLFTLPVGYRPTSRTVVLNVNSYGGNAVQSNILGITASGVVSILQAQTKQYLGFDDISFEV